MNKKYQYLPSEMKQLNRFIGWRKKELKGKVAKLPYSLIDGQSSRWNQPDSWLDFEEANTKNVPLGFVLNDDGISCLDLDNAIQGGKLTKLAKKIINEFKGSYMELSQSGKGIHIFCKGKIPRNLNLSKQGIEMYQNDRYIALTGNVSDGRYFPLSNQLLDKQEKLTNLYQKWSQGRLFITRTLRNYQRESLNQDFIMDDLSVDEILETMKKTNYKASQLLTGVSLTGDHSRDDFIFLVLARNYTGGNSELMKELFLMTPLNRIGTNEKRRDNQKYLEYLDNSIESVLELGHFLPFDWSRHFQSSKGRNLMSEFKLIFPESKQTYQYMDFMETEKGAVRQIVSNLNIALMNPKYCQEKGIYEGQIFFDEFTKEIKFQGRIIGEKDVRPNQIRLWDDALTNRLGIEIEKHFGINYNANKMWEAVRFVAIQYSVNPPKQYLKRLEWKGDTNVIRNLLPTYLGAEDTKLNNWIMEHIILGMIKRVLEPGAKFDEMMVLVGGQGIGKSTFTRYLAIKEDWFCTIENILGKDAVMNLMGKTVVEIEEFVALRNTKSANEAKSFLSKLSDRIRLPYERSAKDIPRTCILIGTLNERTFLNDHTGERRYLPVECFKERRSKSIYLDKDFLGCQSEEEYLSSIREDFNQALAYGYHLYKNHLHSWTIPKELIGELKKKQEKFKYLNPDVEDVRFFLEEYKPSSQEPNITCFKELSMKGYGVKSKAFSEIMESYFPEWKAIRNSKTMRISPSGISIPVKLYYQKNHKIENDFEEIETENLLNE